MRTGLEAFRTESRLADLSHPMVVGREYSSLLIAADCRSETVNGWSGRDAGAELPVILLELLFLRRRFFFLDEHLEGGAGAVGVEEIAEGRVGKELVFGEGEVAADKIALGGE